MKSNTQKNQIAISIFFSEEDEEDHGGMSSGEESELDQELETSR